MPAAVDSASPSKTRRFTLLSLGAVALLLAITCHYWMSELGLFLVAADVPQSSDAILVLSGDYSGARILVGAELCRRGLAKKVWVSGQRGFFGLDESQLSIPFAVNHGYPREMFVAVPHSATSTLEEAQVIVPLMRQAGVKRLMVVTSNFHTRRAGKVFHRFAPDLDIRMIEAPFYGFDPAHWWREREWRKTFLMEWSKTLAYSVGM